MASTKPPIPVGTAQANTQGRLGPATWELVWYFAVGTWDPAHLDDATTLIGIALHDFFNTAMSLGAFDPSWSTKVHMIKFRDATDSLYRVPYADAQAGTAGAEVMPAQVSYLLNLITNDDRRGGKPRKYIPGVSDDLMTDSVTISSSEVNSRNTALATWLAGLGARSHGTASGLVLQEVSFRDGKTWRDTAHTWPVRGIVMNPIVATQRRRVDRLRL